MVKHHESTELQCKLADRAVALGWPRDRVLVIDNDLGESGTTAEIGLNHVGLVLGMKTGRLAGSLGGGDQRGRVALFLTEKAIW